MNVDEDSAHILDLALLDLLAWAFSGLCPDVINSPYQAGLSIGLYYIGKRLKTQGKISYALF